MNGKSKAEILARKLRDTFFPYFDEDTAQPGTTFNVPSAGHCAAVSYIISKELGGNSFSTYVDGTSHWYNSIAIDGEKFDIDVTGDQFGLPEIQVELAGHLYPAGRVRSSSDLASETVRRAELLEKRIGLEVIRSLKSIIEN